MGSVTDGLKTINSTIRTLILAVLVGGGGLLGYLTYAEYTKQDRIVQEQREQLTALQGEVASRDATIEQLSLSLQEKNEEIDRLATSLTLLKTDHRLARLNVVGVERDEAGKAVSSQLEFVELSPQGSPLGEAKSITLPGDVVYVDNWVVKFDDEFVEKNDLERGTSLCLFRRIFSEEQVPSEGTPLDEVGMRPQAYSRGGQMSEFESQLWDEFWEFANDPKKAADMGIRAAHGEAVSIQIREGNAYNIELRASGGLSIQPVGK